MAGSSRKRHPNVTPEPTVLRPFASARYAATSAFQGESKSKVVPRRPASSFLRRRLFICGSSLMTSDTIQQKEMQSRYRPEEVESKWYAFWEESGLFQPSLDSDAKPFVITIPPPNITG